MTPAEIMERLRPALGDGIEGIEDTLLDPAIRLRPDCIHEACRVLRDDLGMDTLRLVTAVDRPPESIDLVWHLLSLGTRDTIVVKTRVSREAPEVATVSDLWPIANWHEREQFDLMGVRFLGHPDLRRLLMPEDWVGHPLRKDYARPDSYHGIPTSRAAVTPVTQYAPPEHLAKAEATDGMMLLNMGPHHPATHGVLNFLLETDGEVLRGAKPDVGYLHRGMEKIAELNVYAANMPYTDRVDYLGAMFTNQGWAMACERLLGVTVPPRAEYLRVIACELNRIASHLVGTGSMAMDLGAYTPFIHWLRERETINDIMERICGARLTYNYMRIGGVSRDIDRQTLDKILVWLDHFEPMCAEFDRLITGNEIFVHRLANVAVLTPEVAKGFAIVGPNLRASGVKWDLRKDEPYSAYPEFDFEVPVGLGWRGSVGDAYDRYVLRLFEIRESVKILRQAIAKIPEGESRAKVGRILKPAANEVYARTEGPRGEAGFYVVADGTDKPWRVRYRTGSFCSMPLIEVLSPRLMVADLVALIGSLDVIAPEVDR